MTPYESVASNASPSLAILLLELHHSIFVYSGASLKKSKHYCDINFINGVNSSSFSSGLKLSERNIKVAEIFLNI